MDEEFLRKANDWTPVVGTLFSAVWGFVGAVGAYAAWLLKERYSDGVTAGTHAGTADTLKERVSYLAAKADAVEEAAATDKANIKLLQDDNQAANLRLCACERSLVQVTQALTDCQAHKPVCTKGIEKLLCVKFAELEKRIDAKDKAMERRMDEIVLKCSPSVFGRL